jgi:hypothetical protein
MAHTCGFALRCSQVRFAPGNRSMLVSRGPALAAVGVGAYSCLQVRLSTCERSVGLTLSLAVLLTIEIRSRRAPMHAGRFSRSQVR